MDKVIKVNTVLTGCPFRADPMQAVWNALNVDHLALSHGIGYITILDRRKCTLTTLPLATQKSNKKHWLRRYIKTFLEVASDLT